jgi:protein-disulfide isomerase
VLKTVCIMCAITYVSVIAIFVVSGGAVTFPMTSLPRRALRDVRTLVTSPLALLIIALFAGSAAAAVTLFPEGAPLSITAPEQSPKLTDEQRREVEKWIAAQPRVDIPVPNDGAKVLVIKFSDFQCPACKQTHDAYRGILAKYAPTQVKFLLKHYPLEGECNSAVQQGNHFASCEASAATVMARASNQADRMTDWLFANQERLSPAVVKEGAKDVAGIADFDARYTRALQEVRTDASLGTMLKVDSTPTFFINGIRIKGGVPAHYFEGIIELELKKAK